MTRPEVVMALGVVLAVFGILVHLLADDLVRRLVALNIASGGVMAVLLAVALRAGGEPDAVPQALVLTGIVIMVAVTGLAVALLRRVEAHEADAAADAAAHAAEGVER